MKIRLRYAPSPTGYLHIGNARTALFNYLYAKHYDGDFIIRIEDTDTSRNIEDGVDSQLNNLKWLGIEWDESIDKPGDFGPYTQLQRHEEGIYTKYAEKLLEEKKAYKCFCSSEELDAEAQRQKDNGQVPKYSGKCRNLTAQEVEQKEAEGLDYTIRFKVDYDQEYTWNDIVKGEVSFKAKDVSGDFNIIKRDGIPTYNFAVVVDDHLMEISHVVRGEDHISNTPKQMMIYQALDFEYPTFGHMTLIVNENNKKLSKRDTGIVQFIEDYKNLGYLPEAMFNFISLLGWSPQGEEEIFSKEQLISIFDEKRLSKSSAKFDVNKLTFINNSYIKKMEDDAYVDFVLPYFNEFNNIYNEEQSKQIIMLYKEQLSYGSEIEKISKVFFEPITKLTDEEKEILQDEVVIQPFYEKIAAATSFTSADFKTYIKEIGKECGVKGKNLFMPLRIATTGQIHGPDLTQTLEILGKDKVLTNITNILELK